MGEPTGEQPTYVETGIIHFVFVKDRQGISFDGILSFVKESSLGGTFIPYHQCSPWSLRVDFDDCAENHMAEAFTKASGKLGDQKRFVMSNPRKCMSLSEFRIVMWKLFVRAELAKSKLQNEVRQDLGKPAVVEQGKAALGIAGLYHYFGCNTPTNDQLIELLVARWETGYMTWLRIMEDDLKPMRVKREIIEE